MSGSGLQDVLQLVYAPNAVDHMLSGKAVERAVRGHFLVETALTSMIVERGLSETCSSDNSNPEPCTPDIEEAVTDDTVIQPQQNTESEISMNTDVDKPEVQKLGQLFEALLSGEVSLEELSSSHELDWFRDRVQTVCQSMKDRRTAKLWLQYIAMIDLLKLFLKAERSGNWQLHLRAVHEMLPYFSAAGHNLYAKSAYIYLQRMTKLEHQHPDVYRHFQQGLHVVRRTDRFWAGLSPDLVIEQVLMKSVKTTGGLTRGRGLTETQRLVWLMSMPKCVEVNNAMQEFTSVSYSTSEQHKDVTDARQKRDVEDTRTLLVYLKDRDPFLESKPLRNIVTGVIADCSVNADNAKAVGSNIVDSLVGKNVVDHSFRRKDQVVTMDNNAVEIRDEVVNIDPQRLVAAGTLNNELKELFQHELCSYPAALFEARGVMRLANKSALADAVWALLPAHVTITPSSNNLQYILDGGRCCIASHGRRGQLTTAYVRNIETT
ncbi:MAG: hypothetical protein ABW185_03025 [Sedimenticola sp.]